MRAFPEMLTWAEKSHHEGAGVASCGLGNLIAQGRGSFLTADVMGPDSLASMASQSRWLSPQRGVQTNPSSLKLPLLGIFVTSRRKLTVCLYCGNFMAPGHLGESEQQLKLHMAFV